MLHFKHFLELSKTSSGHPKKISSYDVTIGVWACPDQLLTGYDYSTKVCHVLLVMDSCISQSA